MANCCSSIRACRRARSSAATPVTISPRAASTPGRRRSDTAGKKVRAARRRCITPIFNLAQFWDGRAADLKAQAKGGQASVEMNATPDQWSRPWRRCRIMSSSSKRRFRTRMRRSLSKFRQSARGVRGDADHPASRFDQFLEGDSNALNAQEKSGLTLFMEKGCVACHNGVNVGGQGYSRSASSRIQGPKCFRRKTRAASM